MNMYVSMHLENLILFVVITKFAFVQSAGPSEGTGQKAHFSLKDTPGSFTVHANKFLAKVSSKPDSIKVIVKPGMAEYPLPPESPTQKPLVHVVSPAIVRPVGGWNYMSFGKKRSKIGGAKRKAGQLSVQRIEQRLFDNHARKEILTNLFKGLRNDVEARKFVNDDKKRQKARYEKAKTLRKRERIRFRYERRFKPRKGFVKLKEKRESVERKMSVQGGTGKFSVHVDSKQSNVSSSTGGVKIFIKNPTPKEMSQLPQGMLQLPGAMVELPQGMSQLSSPLSQLTQGTQKPPFVVVPIPHWDDGDE